MKLKTLLSILLCTTFVNRQLNVYQQIYNFKV